jgi:damage-control phosphatase, subfamily II, stand-alone protein
MKLYPFNQLRDPSTYQACAWDMRKDAEARTYWCTFFKKHVRTIISLGIDVLVLQGTSPDEANRRAAALLQEFDATYDAFAHASEEKKSSAHTQRVTMLTLDEWRDNLLRRHGFTDPFSTLKDNENAGVIALLPTVCRQLDALSGIEQTQAVIEGVFAGNIFDMGAAGSAQLLLDGKLDFFATRKKLPARPWLIDDFNAFANRAQTGWRKAVFFVDNAGSDFVLGAVPMMRWLAVRGTHVILATNERPTLNDMTYAEVKRWWPKLCDVEPSLIGLPINIISTGTGEPLIDLSGVSSALNDASHDADLVILEGMGRGVESNLDAAFVCDAVNLAMLKDPFIARRLGGRLYDVVCRFR